MPLDLRELPLYQEGHEEGSEIGREEGREEGAAETLAVLLDQLVGPLSDGQRECITALRGATLAKLTKVAVSISTKAELDAWLQTHGSRP